MYEAIQDEQRKLTDEYSDAVNEHHAAVKALGTIFALGCGDFYKELARARAAGDRAERLRREVNAYRHQAKLVPISVSSVSRQPAAA